MSDRPHTPVLIAPVLEALSPGPGGLMIDATFGAGGYSRALLERGASVVAFDRDPTVQRFADALTAEFGDRFRLVPGRYSEMGDVLPTLGIAACQGVVFDIGVSSMQLDEAERGFSFMRDGPLDMRMGRDGESAADIVNTYSPEDIARILWVYGEERASRRIAAVLVKRRAEARFERTIDLAETVEKALGGRRGAPVHPATRTFQALRIAVNDELGELERGLVAAEQLLAPGGRLAVVTFHSLEDRIAKTFLIERAGLTPAGSRHLPPGVAGPAPTFELLFRGAREASPQELADNPRARSAKLRAAVRTAAEPMGRREDVVDGRGAKRGRSGHSRSASRLLASPSPGLSRGSSSHPQIGGGLQLGPRDKPGEGEGKGFAFGSSRAGRPTVPEGQEVAR